MNFDIGDVLSRAIQITWKNKSFWLFSALPIAVNFLIFPAMILPMIFFGTDSRGQPMLFENPVFIIFFILFAIAISVLTFVLYTAGTSSLTLGIVNVTNGEGALPFRELLKQGMKYFTRILGVGLLIGVTVSVVFTAIFFGMAAFGAITAGIGFICIQPFLILMYPLMMMLYALIEQSNAAVVADDLGVTDAISKAWSLTKSNFWRILLVSLIIYFGISVVSSIVVVPFMIPLFFFPFLFTEPSQIETSMRTFGWIMLAFGAILLPVMALVQGITITFMKSAYVIMYLRLARPASRPVPVEATL